MGDRNPKRFRSREGRFTFANHKDRRTTGQVRGHDETIENGESRNFQAGRRGIAHQDGGSFVHWAGSRFETE
jgi:hypothetical protein